MSDAQCYKGIGFDQEGQQNDGYTKGSYCKGYKGKGIQLNSWTGHAEFRSMSSMDGSRVSTLETSDRSWNEQGERAYGPWTQAAGGMFSMTTLTYTAPWRSRPQNRFQASERDDEESNAGEQMEAEQKQHHQKNIMTGLARARNNRWTFPSSCTQLSSSECPASGIYPENSAEEPPATCRRLCRWPRARRTDARSATCRRLAQCKTDLRQECGLQAALPPATCNWRDGQEHSRCTGAM